MTIYNDIPISPSVTIDISDTVSSAYALDDRTLCGLYIPSTFDGTTITFQSCDTFSGTYSAVKDGNGNAISKTVAANDYIKLDPSDFAGCRNIKIVAGTAQSTSTTVIKLAIRHV